MISWITIVILSTPRRSTSGRAPWFSAIIRFWIKVESLKRPPTLFTISSSFSSSSIECLSFKTIRAQGDDQVFDTTVEVVVDQLNIIPMGFGKLLAGLDQPAEDRRLVVGPPTPQTLLQQAKRGGPDEHEQRRWGGGTNLQRPFDLDL